MGYFVGFTPDGWWVAPWDFILSKYCSYNIWAIIGIAAACLALGFLVGWFIKRSRIKSS